MREPLNLLDQWIQLINIVDIDNLLNLYDSEAILIPTFSDRILNTSEKLRGYFETLGAYQDLTVTVHEKTVAIQDLQKDIFLLSGIYSWCFTSDGENHNFQARFSYLINLSKTSPILHHHSSQVPHQL